jgi:nitronate monooxygenase
MSLRTPLCDLLGIEVPILQSGMGQVAGPELVAEVCEAGGLGIVAGLYLEPDELRARLRKVRTLTRRPFGVNLWLHADLRPPADVARVPEATVQAVQAVLNRFRARLGLPARDGRPPAVADVVDSCVEVILDEHVPVFSVALGIPDAALVARCHAQGTRVISMAASVADARAQAGAGVDAIVAQGAEAGGHRSIGDKPPSPAAVAVGTIALVPQVVDAVRVPVVAAGGLADGRGLVAALALGAQGVLLGTRFVATRESAAKAFHKKALLEAESDATALSDSVSGLWARYLANTYVREYDAARAPVLPGLVQTAAAQDIFAEGARREDPAYVPMATGQSVGLVRDLPGAREVVEALVREAEAVLARLPRPR